MKLESKVGYNLENLALGQTMKNTSELTPRIENLKQQDCPKTNFKHRVIRENVISCYQSSFDLDLDQALTESDEGMAALNAAGGLQEMLAAQMLSIHQLQQTSMAYANNTTHPEAKKYYSSTTIKLANCFVQQATLLAKLQGTLGQQISIKHVEINEGGQAVVGHISGASK